MGNCKSKNDEAILSEVDIEKIKNENFYDKKYTARVIDVHDGDTMKVLIIVRSKITIVDIRLYGADAFEITLKTVNRKVGETNEEFEHRKKIAAYIKELGLKAKSEVLSFIGAGELLPNGKKTQEYFSLNKVFVELEPVEEKDKFGRMLANIKKNNKYLADHLIDKNLAIPYYGGTKTQEEFAEELMNKSLK